MGVTVKHRRNCRGFSLIELLLVIAIVALLAALLLPAISKGYARGKRTKCLANLKQLGIGFHAFAHDHNDKFPTQVSTNSGGTLEFINNAGLDIAGAFRTFQALSNELLDPKILVCPADTRVAAADFRALKNENVSYFVAPFAEMGRSESLLAGDRNLILLASSSPPTGVSGWTQELHEGQGNVLFADARAELVTGGGVQGLVASSKTPIVVMLPSASATSTTPAAGRGTTVAGGPPNAVNGAGIANRSGSGTAAVGGGAAGPASSRNDGGAQALDSFEQMFQGPPGSKAAMGSRGQSSPPGGSAGFPNPSVAPDAAEKTTITKVLPVTNAPVSNVPDTTAGDPWAISFGHFVTRVGSRSAWWLLLLLLAALITIEVIRRRRARKNAEAK